MKTKNPNPNYRPPASRKLRDITYCSAAHCPFSDCMRHLKRLCGISTIITVSDLTSVCDRYIQYTYREELNEDHSEP